MGRPKGSRNRNSVEHAGPSNHPEMSDLVHREPKFEPINLQFIGFSGHWAGDPVLRPFYTKATYEEALESGKWKIP